MHQILTAALGSFLASLGFGVLFNIRQKSKLFVAGLIGGAGGFVYELLLVLHASDLAANFMAANFMAAIVFTVFAEISARKMKTPVTSFIVCALIPLVPGGDDVRYDDRDHYERPL